MALTRAQKEVNVAALAEKLGKQKALTFTAYSGLTVAEMTELRSKLYAEGVELVVVKNRLFQLALQKAGLTLEGLAFNGPVAVAFSYDDEVVGAKILAEFGKKHEKLVLTGGVLENNLLSADAVTQLAKLPSKDEMRAQVVYLIKSPVSGLVGVLHNTVASIVHVLKNYADAKGGQQ